LAPDLIWSELGNIAWKRAPWRNEARRSSSTHCRPDADAAGRRRTQGLLAPALELAIATDRTVYDCMYLALAIDRQCRVVTADRHFVNALARTTLARHIRHVTNLR
jgi:predicted nucleic acid-binding protein